MQTVDTKVDGCALTNLGNLVLDLTSNLGNNLLDACGVDMTI